MCLSLIEIYLLIGTVGLLSIAFAIWTFGGNDMSPILLTCIVVLTLMIFIRGYLNELTLAPIFVMSLLICIITMIQFQKSSPLMPRKEVHAFTVATITRRAKHTAEQLMSQMDPDEEHFEIHISTAGVPWRLTDLFISEVATEFSKHRLSLSSLERAKNGRQVVLERIPTRMMRTNE
ncbi:MAG: hypothetical protein KBC15_01775 [Candidatus Levybacteria bacterium]|nr:hypothetical protein [Candidatus Levybacteria bacterium]